MNTPRWERAKDIFDSALDLPDELRASFLSQSCGDDPELRREVEGLLAADAEASGFMNPAWLAPFSPFVTEPEFQLVAGDVVSGRFRILRPLGDGGMGRVYEAHDSVLGVRVALKTLRPEISANPEVLFRFQQEVRIAHRITHPNVCRTYHLDHELRHIGPDDSSSIDLSFLTMEYLEGETLQQLLKRNGPVPLERAHLIARQMADAIAAAHDIGVIHRDIKPSNVMICPSSKAQTAATTDRVVMTDFGLAKFEAGARNNDLTSMSQPGRAMGTLAYMSPEQLRGEEVGAPSDIYAFGLVLYEMVTGVKAFPNSETMEAAYRRVIEAPPSPRTLAPELPDTWNEAVLGCLQIDPAVRFQQATDVVAVLEGRLPRSSHARSSQRSAFQRLSTLSRRKVATISLFVACVALSSIGLRYFSTRRDAAVAPGALVYLAPVKNETGEKRLDNVTELVQAGLGQSAHINLLDTGRAGDILQQMMKKPGAEVDIATAREISLRAGARRTIFLSLSRAANKYVLNADIQQPDASNVGRFRHHTQRTFSWASTEHGDVMAPEMLTTLRDATTWIRLKVGESEDDIERLDVPPEDVTTDRWDALSAYASAEQYQRTRRTEEALSELKRATEFDPHFSLAYARMGDLKLSLGRREEGYDNYERALSTDFDRRLTRRELDRIRGTYAADTWDYRTAEDTFRDMTVFYPDDYLGWFYRGFPLARLNRFAEARAVLQKAYELNRARSSAPYDLAVVSIRSGSLIEAKHWIDVLRGQHENEAVEHLTGLVDFLTGDLHGAQDSFLQLTKSPAPFSQLRGYTFLTRLAAERGDNGEGLTWAENGFETAAAQGNQPKMAQFLLDRAHLLFLQKKYRDSMAEMRRALALDQGPDTTIAAAKICNEMLPFAGASDLVAVRAQVTALRRLVGTASENRMSEQLARATVEAVQRATDRDWNAALYAARRAAMLDERYVRRPVLISTLQRAAADSTGETRMHQLTEAHDTLAATAMHPYALWAQAENELPGALRDDVEEMAAISDAMGEHTDGANLQALAARPASHAIFQTHSNRSETQRRVPGQVVQTQ